jgi:hypothetical protein
MTIIDKNRILWLYNTAAECKYECVHTELVQVFYDNKWISSGAFEFVK